MTDQTTEQAMEMYRLVREMRIAQRRYFRNRHHDDLVVAKQWEAEVDKLIAEIENASKPKQEGLW